MVDIIEKTDRPTAVFKAAVAAPEAKVTLEIEPDIAEYLKSQFPDGWQAHAKEREFEHVAQQEPGETAAPAPALT